MNDPQQLRELILQLFGGNRSGNWRGCRAMRLIEDLTVDDEGRVSYKFAPRHSSARWPSRCRRKFNRPSPKWKGLRPRASRSSATFNLSS